VIADAVAATKDYKWIPSPGPQTEAYFSLADCLLYGGEPGGGKSQLLLGLAFNCHQRSLIMRRQYSDIDRIVEDALKIHGSRDGFNGSPPPRLRISDEKVINFRAAQRIGDEQGTMGQGRDLLGLDEATHFAESQVRFLMGWVRSEEDADFQVIPTQWLIEAQGRWKPDGFKAFNMTAMAFDPAGGGADAAELGKASRRLVRRNDLEKGEETATDQRLRRHNRQASARQCACRG
jgi:hypothetical protein